jgi:molybdate transport system substrate-binding protein
MDGIARTLARLVVLTIGTGILVFVACAGGGDTSRSRLRVFAAASLTDAFDQIGDAFETAHPEIDLSIAYAASSTLREQILEGAPADVYASADPENMTVVVDSGAVAGAPVPFARNQMEIAVPIGNAAGVTGLADFGRDDLLIGLCAEQVPCGAYGRRVLAGAGVVPSVDTDEPSVRFLVTKIETGELDAGLVYRSDVASSERVTGIGIPDHLNLDAHYPIAILENARDPEAARMFVDFVLGNEGREILENLGFLAP